jgi:hypothetical protein
LISFLGLVFFGYVHLSALSGLDYPKWYGFMVPLVFIVFVGGIIHVRLDVKQIVDQQKVAKVSDVLLRKPFFLLVLLVCLFVYGLSNFVRNLPGHPVQENNGKFYKIEKRSETIEISEAEYKQANLLSDIFFSGHILIFVGAALVMNFWLKKPEEEKEPIAQETDFSRFETPEQGVYEYKGEDSNFWVRGVKHYVFYLYLIQALPFLVYGFFSPGAFFIPAFLSLMLINIYILQKYHLVRVRADKEFVELEYYDFLTKHIRKVARKDLSVVFVPKEIRGNVFYELIVCDKETFLFKQSSANNPFTYKKTEAIYNELNKKLTDL